MAKRGAITDDGFRLSDELWGQTEPLLPARSVHPLGCHRPRTPDRMAMDAIFFVLRTGCQWNALNATGICSSSSAHRRFQEWTEAGVFEAFWHFKRQPELTPSRHEDLTPMPVSSPRRAWGWGR